MAIVPVNKTVVTPTAMFDSLVKVWHQVVGTTPTRAQILMLLAQWALETGNGASENNYNPGGIKSVSGDGFDSASYTTTEVINGVTQTLTQTFAAYPDLDAGTTAYVKLLQNHYPQAWQSILEGGTDATAFAQGLKNGGYYTAPVQNTVGADGQMQPGYAPGLIARLATMSSSVPDSEPLVVPSAFASGSPLDAFNNVAGLVGMTPLQFMILLGVTGYVGWTIYNGDARRFVQKLKVFGGKGAIPAPLLTI
jgi:hypothetical protein